MRLLDMSAAMWSLVMQVWAREETAPEEVERFQQLFTVYAGTVVAYYEGWLAWCGSIGQDPEKLTSAYPGYQRVADAVAVARRSAPDPDLFVELVTIIAREMGSDSTSGTPPTMVTARMELQVEYERRFVKRHGDKGTGRQN